MSYGSRTGNMLGDIIKMKKNMTIKQYKKFTELLDELKKENIRIPHTVEYKNKKTFTVELNLSEKDRPDLEKIIQNLAWHTGCSVV